MIVVRCLKCGETDPRLLDVAASPSGQLVHVVCNVCSGVSFLGQHRVETCPECSQFGTHRPSCGALRAQGVA